MSRLTILLRKRIRDLTPRSQDRGEMRYARSFVSAATTLLHSQDLKGDVQIVKDQTPTPFARAKVYQG